MASTPVRLTRHLPWRRGPEPLPDHGAAQASFVVPRDEPAPIVAQGDSPTVVEEARQPGPVRGPNGRFVRRAAPTSVATVTAIPVEPAETVTLAAVDADTDAVDASPELPFWVGRQPAEPGPVDEALRAPRLIRVALVEDLPDVATHVRDILRWQPRFTLVHVVTDGRRAVDEIHDFGPDVVVVDSLLQGRADARAVVEQLRKAGSPVGIVVLTVPDHEVDKAIARHADAVVALPFGTIDLGHGILEAHRAATERDPSATSRIVAVYSPKGGVGTTTIAYNLAASLAATGLQTLLVDGSLQFGDLRRLLRADPALPSICDLPTDRVRGSDLADTVVRDASGVDVLLAPPRPELAELVDGRDLELLLGVLRRAYQAIVVDTPSNLSETTLAFLDAADIVVDVLTADPATLEITRLIGATFAEVGYGSAKVRYLVNRTGEAGSVSGADVAEALGRDPDYAVASDWAAVTSSNAARVPVVLARPDSPASADLRRLAERIRAVAVARAGRVSAARGRAPPLTPGEITGIGGSPRARDRRRVEDTAHRRRRP